MAGGVGAGKFLRGLVRVVPAEDLTVILNVADDVVVHGLHVSPDPDSVTYWLGDAFDRDRGWGRRGDTFRATAGAASLRRPDAWFNLGDLDLATHVLRSRCSAPAPRCRRSSTGWRLGSAFVHGCPATDDRVETRIDAVDVDTGRRLDLHFQEYWVRSTASIT